MFAGDRAAERDGEIHHPSECDLCAFGHVRVCGVEDDERVGVSVSGVRHRADQDVEVVCDGFDPGYQLGECAHGNAHVFEKQTSHREHGREHRSPCRRKSVTFGLVIGGEYFGGSVVFARLNNRLDFQHACRAGCVGLREQ